MKQMCVGSALGDPVVIQDLRDAFMPCTDPS
jgi:hypothetical protein